MQLQREYSTVLTTDVQIVGSEVQFNLGIEPAWDMWYLLIDKNWANQEELFYHRKSWMAVFAYQVNRQSVVEHQAGTQVLLANSISYMNHILDMIGDHFFYYKKDLSNIVVKWWKAILEWVLYDVQDFDTSLPGNNLTSNATNYIYLIDWVFSISTVIIPNELLILKVVTDLSWMITSIEKYYIMPLPQKGDTWATGPQGIQWPQWIQGDTWATWPQGPQWNIGNTWPQGPQGVQGDTGPQGPQWIQGIQWDTGPQGPQGNQWIQGPQGIQWIQWEKWMNWLWLYNWATAYVVDDAVSYNWSSYICILASTGNIPTNTTYWSMVAQKGNDGLGSGDMLKATYDSDNDWIVDHAELADTAPWAWISDKPATFPPSAHNHDSLYSPLWHNHDSSYYLKSEITTFLSGKQNSLWFTPENSANKWVADGYASLDGSWKVPSAQLPSFVDDVLEYASFAGLPWTGETGKIYVTLDTNKTYRWSGSAYVEISPSPWSTDSVTEGSTNLYFTTARVLWTLLTGLSTATNAVIAASDSIISALGKLQKQITDLGTSKENSITLGTTAQYWRGDKSWQTLDKTAVGLANVDNTSDANKPVSTATQTALNLKANLISPAFTTPDLGTPSAGNLSNCTADGTNKVGYLNIPQNSQSGAYTLVLADAGKHIYHPSADTTARTFIIPANSSVAFPIGTPITFVNDTSAGAITIAITTDTLVLAGAGTTGSRTLASNGVATAIKVTSTRWIISGTNLT